MKKNKARKPQAEIKPFPIPPALFVIVESILLTFILEVLSRRSLASAFKFLTRSPALFIFNALIIMVTLCVAFLFSKKVFTLSLVTAVWLAFGIANCVVLGYRSASPLTSVDLQLGMEAVTMMHIYFEVWQIVLIIGPLIGLIVGLVYLAIKSPKFKLDFQKQIVGFFMCSVLLLGYGNALFQSDDMLSDNLRPSLYDSYLKYGFPYCFCYSFFDIGISKPEGYSGKEVANISDGMDIPLDIDTDEDEDDADVNFFDEFIDSVRLGVFTDEPEGYTVEAVNAIRELLTASRHVSETEKPNVVFVQLESFFDPYTLPALEYSADPIPNFRRLAGEYTSGKLYVPTVAGGTANTEFEVLTGMSLDYFGAGEFPYYSILKEKACESLATDLRAIDYTATAIHNYMGSFYYRHIVYKNLGFDRFVPIEYMGEYETTLMDWPKDEILTGEIIDALESTPGSDFVYAVAVQTHGRYIPLPEDIPPVIEVTGAETEQRERELEYFLMLLNEVDEFVGELTDAISNIDENTIVVFFGDHLPGLGLEPDDLSTESLYATEYVIWSNYELEKADADLESYQLGAYALKQVGISAGVMIKYHQTQMSKPEYLRNLEILEYDMLYGDRYIYRGKELTSSETMSMGVYPVTISAVEVRYENLFVRGANFTPSSVVCSNDDRLDGTIYVSESLLVVPEHIPKDGDLISVGQYTADSVLLGESEAFECVGLVPIKYTD